MKIATLETFPVSVPYRHREVSSQVARDGVSDVLVKLTTDEGHIGWGEACCGADTASVEAALHAMTPFVLGAIRGTGRRCAATCLRTVCGSSAPAQATLPGQESTWPCGTSVVEPAASLLWRLLGGLQQKEATYFFYLARGPKESLAAQVAEGLEAGFEVFYLKVGLDDAEDLEMVSTVREQLGAGPRLRIDANGSWTIPQALRNLRAMCEYDIDFVEQPVRDHPIGQLAEVRARIDTAVCANEGLWSEADAYARIRRAETQTSIASPYWVGSIGSFHRLSWLAQLRRASGLQAHPRGARARGGSEPSRAS